MGFLDKVKNLFTEEEEVYEEPIKKEVIKVEIPAPEVTKEEVKEKEVVKPEPVMVEPKPEEPKKPAPVFFDDKDFENIERRVSKPKPEPKKKKEEEPKRVAYQMSKQRLHEEKKNFKPSPIISPVYGVLDKNYHKDDIVPKREFRTDHVGGELTIDDVRNKAYGTLEDDIDATLFGAPKEEKKAPVNGLEDDIFKDLELDMGKEDVTMDTHMEVEDDAEFQLDEPKKEENIVEEAMTIEEPEKKTRKKRAKEEVEEDKKEDNLDDSDLFNLIDSFYEKRDEEE